MLASAYLIDLPGPSPLGIVRRVSRDFPGGPVVKTSPSDVEGASSIPGQGTGSHMSCGKNNNNKKPQNINSRSNIAANSIKTLKMVHIKKTFKKKKVYTPSRVFPTP